MNRRSFLAALAGVAAAPFAARAVAAPSDEWTHVLVACRRGFAPDILILCRLVNATTLTLRSPLSAERLHEAVGLGAHGLQLVDLRESGPAIPVGYSVAWPKHVPLVRRLTVLLDAPYSPVPGQLAFFYGGAAGGGKSARFFSGLPQ